MKTSPFLISEIIFSLLIAAASLLLLALVFFICYLVFKIKDDERLTRIFFITMISMIAFFATSLLVVGMSYAFVSIDIMSVVHKWFKK